MIRSIRRRAIVAMLVVIAITTVTFGSVAVIVSDRVEDTLLNTMIQRETDFLIELIRRQSVVDLPQSSQTQAWYTRAGHGHLPAAFAALPLGIVHEVAHQGERFHVQRSAIDGGVLTVALEITALETREHQFQFVMVGGGLAVATLSLCAGLWLSRRVAAPITRLSNELQSLEPEDLKRRFAARYRDAEIHGIAEALDHYMDRLRRMVERERGFAAAASHEIRSPLTVIRGALELAALDSQLGPTTRRTLARAQRSVEGLGRVLDGLLELAREPATAGTEPLDAAHVVEDVLAELGDTPAAGERFDWQRPPTPVTLCAPEGHWRMLVRNLVDNAVQHAADGPIEIRLDARGFSVRDHGPGITPELLPHLFERSRRGIQSSGAGLGLYIASELADRHGWSLRAANEASGGSRFSVDFGTAGHAAVKPPPQASHTP